MIRRIPRTEDIREVDRWRTLIDGLASHEGDFIFGGIDVRTTLFTSSWAACVDFRNGYWQLMCKGLEWVPVSVAPQATFLRTINRWHYGTFQFTMKTANVQEEASIIVFAMEDDFMNFICGFGLGWTHGFTPYWGWGFATTNAGQIQITELPGRNWSVDTIVRCEWQPTYVRLYLNNVLVANHTIGIPQIPLPFACEIFTTPTSLPEIATYFYIKDFVVY